MFGLLGPNGAGKTTTILMLLGLTEPTGGGARVLDLDPARNPVAVKRHVGYLPDNVGFYGGLTGRDNLHYTARLNGIGREEADARIDTLLRRVGMFDAGDMKVEKYSRGMRQRLGLADVLVKDPSVIILDEPTTAIDPAGVVEVLQLVRELARDGAAVLLASHLLAPGAAGVRPGRHLRRREGCRGGNHGEARRRTRKRPHLHRGRCSRRRSMRFARRHRRCAALPRWSPTSATAGSSSSTPTATFVATLARALVEAGHPPFHLRRRGDELDEIYRRYFGATEPAEAPLQ